MSNYNSGKYLEQSVKKYFDSIKSVEFRYRRLQDSTAARNLISANPGDFFVCWKGQCFFLECKTTNSKTFRLTRPTQLPELLAWDRAGLPSWFLVHYYVPDLFTWVLASDLDPSKPSHDLSDYKKFKTVEEAINIC